MKTITTFFLSYLCAIKNFGLRFFALVIILLFGTATGLRSETLRSEYILDSSSAHCVDTKAPLRGQALHKEVSNGFNLAVPMNDLCENAVTLPVNLPGDCIFNQVVGTTEDALLDDFVTSCDGSPNPGVFYTFNSGSYSSIIVSYYAITANDLVLTVKTGCTGTEVACGVNTGSLIFSVTPSTTYTMNVSSLPSNPNITYAGSFEICVQGAKDCPALDANIGDSCNDGNINTTGDVVTADCECEGTLTAIGAPLTGTANWISECGSRNMAIVLYTPGTASLFTVYFTTISASGDFSVPLFPLGTFDIFVKVVGYLQKAVGTVTVTPSGATIAVGEMINGDINNSDGINISDLTALSAVFGQVEGSAGYNPNADLNCSGGVNISDLTVLSSNFGVSGQDAPLATE